MTHPRRTAHGRIQNLADHPHPYVTTSELAAYWMVSRKQIYKQIEAGTLKAIRLGPRLLRVNTAEAMRFEALAKMQPTNGCGSEAPAPGVADPGPVGRGGSAESEAPKPRSGAVKPRAGDDRAHARRGAAAATRRVAASARHRHSAADGKPKRRQR